MAALLTTAAPAYAQAEDHAPVSLPSAQQMTQDKAGTESWTYAQPTSRFLRYRTVIVDPTVVYQGPDAQFEGIDPADRAKYAQQGVLVDGTILVLHSTNHGVVREPMNLRRPHALTGAGGEPINALLRRRTAHDTSRTPHLMSELFAGFGTVFGAEPLAQAAARRPARSSRRR